MFATYNYGFVICEMKMNCKWSAQALQINFRLNGITFRFLFRVKLRIEEDGLIMKGLLASQHKES